MLNKKVESKAPCQTGEKDVEQRYTVETFPVAALGKKNQSGVL